MGKKYSYDDDWIKQHLQDVEYCYELHDLYNKEHGTNFLLGTFQRHLREALGIQFGKSYKKFTEEETQFVKDNYENMTDLEFKEAFEAKFGKKVDNYIYHKAWQLGVHKKREIRNRSMSIGRAVHKIGDEVVEHPSSKSYILVKIKDTGKATDQWERKQRVVWEREHGPIPPDHAIIFLDGNTMNCNIENLACVPIKYRGYVIGAFRKGNNSETIRVKYKWAELYHKLKEDNNES